MASPKQIEFRTVDGLTLRGVVYQALQRGPALVMCPGFNCVKDMAGLPTVAAGFQAAGITALLFDPRCVGLSDGEPRNDINPSKQIEDYSDALTFLGTLPMVDPRKIGFWGTSLSASVALSAAAMDWRAKLVIAACPITEYQYDPEKMQRVLKACIKDRESRVKGNPPFYIPMIDETGENPAGLNFGFDRARASQWSKSGLQLAPTHVNRTTIQSYAYIATWEPWTTWKHLKATPVLFLVPEKDEICSPLKQLQHFDRLTGPKRCHRQGSTGHMDLFEGEHVGSLVELQVAFVVDALTGRVGTPEMDG
ncbi:hypothetical protein EKO27_g10071 [Xylaria grammica]|uniref:AB hydrolase-1 domain-containing protein n=1 Tax=Xylaria grammica TaxID=363999 RepID=A0A439CSC5_9PEZI|nr:hypothetical protein EKO27_g10071 [Xylaria grammica]